MSTSHKVTKRYAKALLDLALEQNSLSDTYSDVLNVIEISKSTRQLIVVLKNPIVLQYKKFRIVHSIFSNEIKPLTLRFIELIVTKNRAHILFEILDNFIELYNEHQKIAHATLITAVEASEDTKSKVTSLLEKASKNTILLENIIDESLIGGFLIRYKDSLIDASVASKLKSLQKELID